MTNLSGAFLENQASRPGSRDLTMQGSRLIPSLEKQSLSYFFRMDAKGNNETAGKIRQDKHCVF
jgi:hypothetical protein